MKAAIEKFLAYLRLVRNASAHTIRNYASDLEQFHIYLTPPDSPPPDLKTIDHRVIREYLGHLHDQQLQKSSMARKLAALRSRLAKGGHLLRRSFLLLFSLGRGDFPIAAFLDAGP